MSKEVKTLNVEGMSCSHCEHSVKKSVGALAGVDSVAVDLVGKKVTVEYDAERVDLVAAQFPYREMNSFFLPKGAVI
ncbi:cation transporter [Pelotomaculum isophthalicicum JI]|uniref:Cation transporter n=1 Tax=Pelotomaculum isophthalicicum JI TaxID=947010 RepID=A0A9X4H5X4_9FIRM|nr:cation transporter [Pelotomaculum isophthalicicum]MDF9410008.1 cation transporter [Pelotomaculum isophthalicicum JI]